jgi:hypothetical protein
MRHRDDKYQVPNDRGAKKRESRKQKKIMQGLTLDLSGHPASATGPLAG